MKNLLVLLLFAGGFYGWYAYHKNEQMKVDVEEARKNLEVFEQRVMTRRSEFQAIITALDQQKQAAAKTEEIKAIKAKEALQEDELRSLEREKGQIISRLRQAWVGTVIPELALVDGRKLVQVRVSKSDESGLSVTSTSGVVKILPKDLPEEWRKKLHYP